MAGSAGGGGCGPGCIAGVTVASVAVVGALVTTSAVLIAVAVRVYG